MSFDVIRTCDKRETKLDFVEADVMDAFVGKMRWQDGDGWNSGICI